MIAKLAGKVLEHDGDQTIVDVGGVGYGVFLNSEDQGRAQIGSDLLLYIHENIRENGHDLYGFTNKTAQKLFELLLSVNGVGPKGALAITNLGSDGSLRSAIAGGDVKFLTGANGIGKKVAERIVVDLKNKVGLVSGDDATGFLKDLPENSQDEALQALTTLGFSPADAASALRGIDPSLSSEQRIKLALKGGI
ncbi:MAG: Holliday junction branch migration protein RuvA [Patescibacteria group bacterium]